MLTKFQEHIKTNFPFLEKSRLLIAISGGIDSVVLTHFLQQSAIEIELAHCNFRLRGEEANIDEQFVKDFAKKLNLKIYTKQFDTKQFAEDQRVSIQMAARKLRYDWFEELLQENNLDYLATAHHLDDNLETFIINFSRGTGLDGLTGIPEVNKKTIRPLLAFSREEIVDYAKENKLEWREDDSNTEIKYTRNKIRHQIIPLLKELNPSLLNSFKQTTSYLQQSQQIIADTLAKLMPELVIPAQTGIYKIDIQKVKNLSNPKAYLYEILKEFGFTEWNDVINLLDAQSGKQVFSETHRLIKDRDHFLLENLSAKMKDNSFTISQGQSILKTGSFYIRVSEKNNHGPNEREPNVVLVSGDKLEFPLILRKWREGDYFYPFGMNGKKKLSKFFKDEKFSLIDKENTWLLCSKNKIAWVVGKRLDHRFRLTKNTKKIVQIEYSKA